jgi:hypothetical protein
VVENDQTTGNESFDGKRMTQQKTPDEKIEEIMKREEFKKLDIIFWLIMY